MCDAVLFWCTVIRLSVLVIVIDVVAVASTATVITVFVADAIVA